MNLKQKQILSTYFPELKGQEASSPLIDSLMIALIGRIESVKGERGEDGKTPKKGEDYFTPQELKEIADYIRDTSIPQEILRRATPIKGKDYRDGKDGINGRDGRPGLKGDRGEIGLMGRPGKDGSPDSPMTIVNKLNTLTGVLNVSVIDGAISKETLRQESKKLLDGMAKVEGRVKLIDQRWHGGGLSSISHDSTMTGLGTPSSPLSVVSGSSAGFQSPTGTVNGSNRVFVFASAPNAIVVDGISLRKTQSDSTVNWTGTTSITLTVAPNFDVYGVA